MPDAIQSSDAPRTSETAVHDRVKKPPGVLPKNAQTWAITGLSVIMVAAIALSGNPGQKAKGSAKQPAQASVADPNVARIAEYRSRLEEETHKLDAEQAALNQTKQALGANAGATTTSGLPMQASSPAAYAPSQNTPVDERLSAQRQLEAEKARKEYTSLFASNVALTYRKDMEGKDPAPITASVTPPAPTPYPVVLPVPSALVPTQAVSSGAPGGDSGRTVGGPPNSVVASGAGPKQPDPELTRANGKSYRILEGTILEAVLTNRLTGSLAGPVNCMVTADVYSHDRQHLLIPQGSRLLGEVKAVNSVDQQRLAVLFHRIVMPDGFSVSLDQFQGLSQIGETGLRDQVNHHYVQIFGASMAIGAIAGLSQANTQYGLTISAEDAYRQGFATSTSQSALRILDRFLNILPTFTIREGNRVKVYLASDLLVPAYDQHQLPGDLGVSK